MVFIWFAFRVIALTMHTTSFDIFVQPFTITLEPSLLTFFGHNMLSIVERQ